MCTTYTKKVARAYEGLKYIFELSLFSQPIGNKHSVLDIRCGLLQEVNRLYTFQSLTQRIHPVSLQCMCTYL